VLDKTARKFRYKMEMAVKSYYIQQQQQQQHIEVLVVEMTLEVLDLNR
jgi:hypothetical protein